MEGETKKSTRNSSLMSLKTQSEIYKNNNNIKNEAKC